MAAKLQQLDLQKLQVESGPIEMFMKFDEQSLKQSRSQNDINNNIHWSRLAGIILSSQKSHSLSKLIWKIDKFRDEYGEDGERNVKFMDDKYNQRKMGGYSLSPPYRKDIKKHTSNDKENRLTLENKQSQSK